MRSKGTTRAHTNNGECSVRSHNDSFVVIGGIGFSLVVF